MFKFFNRRKKEPEDPSGYLVFTDDERGADAFFQLQSKYGDQTLEPNHSRLAVVIYAPKMFGCDPMPPREDGSHEVMLRVPSEDGGFYVLATTPRGSNGEILKPHDFVVWIPFQAIQGKFRPSHFLGDPRSDWFGVIRAKTSRTFEKTEVVCRYD